MSCKKLNWETEYSRGSFHSRPVVFLVMVMNLKAKLVKGTKKIQRPFWKQDVICEHSGTGKEESSRTFLEYIKSSNQSTSSVQ